MKKNDTRDAQCVCAVLMRRYEILPDADSKDYYWNMKQLVFLIRWIFLIRSWQGFLAVFQKHFNSCPDFL